MDSNRKTQKGGTHTSIRDDGSGASRVSVSDTSDRRWSRSNLAQIERETDAAKGGMRQPLSKLGSHGSMSNQNKARRQIYALKFVIAFLTAFISWLEPEQATNELLNSLLPVARVSAYTLTTSPFGLGPNFGTENCNFNITAMATDGRTDSTGMMIIGAESKYGDDGTCVSSSRASVIAQKNSGANNVATGIHWVKNFTGGSNNITEVHFINFGTSGSTTHSSTELVFVGLYNKDRDSYPSIDYHIVMALNTADGSYTQKGTFYPKRITTILARHNTQVFIQDTTKPANEATSYTMYHQLKYFQGSTNGYHSIASYKFQTGLTTSEEQKTVHPQTSDWQWPWFTMQAFLYYNGVLYAGGGIYDKTTTNSCSFVTTYDLGTLASSTIARHECSEKRFGVVEIVADESQGYLLALAMSLGPSVENGPQENSDYNYMMIHKFRPNLQGFDSCSSAIMLTARFEHDGSQHVFWILDAASVNGQLKMVYLIQQRKEAVSWQVQEWTDSDGSITTLGCTTSGSTNLQARQFAYHNFYCSGGGSKCYVRDALFDNPFTSTEYIYYGYSKKKEGSEWHSGRKGGLFITGTDTNSITTSNGNNAQGKLYVDPSLQTSSTVSLMSARSEALTTKAGSSFDYEGPTISCSYTQYDSTFLNSFCNWLTDNVCSFSLEYDPSVTTQKFIFYQMNRTSASDSQCDITSYQLKASDDNGGYTTLSSSFITSTTISSEGQFSQYSFTFTDTGNSTIMYNDPPKFYILGVNPQDSSVTPLHAGDGFKVYFTCKSQTYTQTVQSFKYVQPKSTGSTHSFEWFYFTDTTFGKFAVSPDYCTYMFVTIFTDSGLTTQNDNSVITSTASIENKKITFSFSQGAALAQDLWIRIQEGGVSASMQISFKVCGAETLTVANSPFLHSDDASSGTGTLDWAYTVASTDSAYTSLANKPPVFGSDDSDCPLKTIEVYTDSGLTTAFQPDANITAVAIDNTKSPPTVSITYSKASTYSKTLYFKGITDGGKSTSAEVTILVCGAETYTISRATYMIVDKVSDTAGTFSWLYTSAAAGALNSDWAGQTDTDKPPYWQTDQVGCDISSISAYSDSGLSAAFSGSDPATVTTASGQFSPSVSLSYQRSTAQEKTLYFKGFAGSQSASTAITFRICDMPVSKSNHNIFNVKQASTTETITWSYTVASEGASDADYQAIAQSDRLPTFESAISGCTLTSLAAYSDSDLTTALTSDVDFNVVTSGSYPTATIDFSLNAQLYKEFWVKGSGATGASSSTKFTVTVCGDETVTNSEEDRLVQINQYDTDDASSFYKDYSESELTNLFTQTYPSGFGGQCGFSLSLWSDSGCSTTKIDASLSNTDIVVPYLVSGDNSGSKYIRVLTDKYLTTTSFYLKGITSGQVSSCNPIRFNVKCGQLSFGTTLTQPIKLEVTQNAGADEIHDLSQYSLDTVNAGCPLDATEPYKLVDILPDALLLEQGKADNEQVFTYTQSQDISTDLAEFVKIVESGGKRSIVVEAKKVVENHITSSTPHTFWVRFMQSPENVVHLKFQLTVNREILDPFVPDFEALFAEPVVEEKPAVIVPEIPVEEEEVVEEKVDAHAEEETAEEETTAASNSDSVIRPFEPPYIKRASSADVSSFRKNQPKPPVIPPPEPKPLMMSMCEISRDGILDLCMSEPCFVPNFQPVKQPQEQGSTKRNVLAMSELNVVRDILDLSFNLQSDVNVTEIQYILNIVKWEEQQLSVEINFTNPLLISQGQQRDFVTVNIKDKTWFRSKVTGEYIDLDIDQNLKITKTIPRQFPKGLNATEFTQQAQSAGNAMTALMILQIILSFCLKGVIDDVWSLFMVLQLVAYTSIYDTSIPANVEIYVGEFRKMVKFEVLKPDFILNMYEPGLTVQKLIQMYSGEQAKLSGSLESSGQSDSFVANMSTYLFVLAVFIVALLVMSVLVLFKKFKDKIKAKLEGIKKKAMWNNTVRSVSITYLETAIQLKVKIDTMAIVAVGTVAPLLGMTAFLVAYPSLCLYFMLKHWTKLDTKEIREKGERMYTGVSLRRGKIAVFYYPISILRRLLFVMIPILFKNYPYMQIQFLIFFSTLYIIWYVSIWPHSQKKLIRIEIYNEALFQCLNYHMVTFTLFNQHIEAQFTMGYSYLFWMGLLLLVNIVYAAHNMVLKFQRGKRMKAARKRAIAEMAENKRRRAKKERKAQKSQRLKEEEDRKIQLRCAKPDYSAKQIKKMEKEFDSQLSNLLQKEKKYNRGNLSVIKEETLNLSIEDMELLGEVKNKGKAFEDFLDNYVENVYNNMSKEEIKKLEARDRNEQNKKKQKDKAFEEFLMSEANNIYSLLTEDEIRELLGAQYTPDPVSVTKDILSEATVSDAPSRKPLRPRPNPIAARKEQFMKVMDSGSSRNQAKIEDEQIQNFISSQLDQIMEVMDAEEIKKNPQKAMQMMLNAKK